MPYVGLGIRQSSMNGVCTAVIFGIYASETFPQMSKVVVDRLLLETEGVVSHDLAELFRQVHCCFSPVTLCDLLFDVAFYLSQQRAHQLSGFPQNTIRNFDVMSRNRKNLRELENPGTTH